MTNTTQAAKDYQAALNANSPMAAETDAQREKRGFAPLAPAAKATGKLKAAAKGKLPLPPRKGLSQEPARAQVDAGRSNVAKPQQKLDILAKGTIIDGVDCSGMIDNPKLAGVPVYLQAQNKKQLTKEQEAQLEAKHAAAAGERAKHETAAKLAAKTKAKAAPAAKQAKPAKPAKAAPVKAKPAAQTKNGKARVRAKDGGPSGMVAEILKLASRANGVSPAELNAHTEWKGAPWKWLFKNPKGNGYCDRWNYSFKCIEDKDGGRRYKVAKKA